MSVTCMEENRCLTASLSGELDHHRAREVMEELDRKVRQHYHLIEGEEEIKESDLKLTPKEEQMELSIEGEE